MNPNTKQQIRTKSKQRSSRQKAGRARSLGWTPSRAQRRAAVDLFKRRRGRAVFGPFLTLLRHPDLMLAAEGLGAVLRYKGVLPARVRELVILVTARAWRQPTEWEIHEPLAREAGLSSGSIRAISAGKRPKKLAAAELSALNFALEVHRHRRASATSIAAVRAIFGRVGAIELSALCGYYALLAMVMNTDRVT